MRPFAMLSWLITKTKIEMFAWPPPAPACFKTQRPKKFRGSVILAGGISEQTPDSSPYFLFQEFCWVLEISHQTGNALFECNLLFNAVKTVLEQDNDLKGSKFYCDNGPYSEKSVNGFCMLKIEVSALNGRFEKSVSDHQMAQKKIFARNRLFRWRLPPDSK